MFHVEHRAGAGSSAGREPKISIRAVGRVPSNGISMRRFQGLAPRRILSQQGTHPRVSSWIPIHVPIRQHRMAISSSWNAPPFGCRFQTELGRVDWGFGPQVVTCTDVGVGWLPWRLSIRSGTT